MQPKRGKLSAPHSGPPASRTRIPDRSSGHYSSPGNQGANRQARGHEQREKSWATEKDEGKPLEERTNKEPRNGGAGIVALFITESPKYRKVPNMGLQKSLSVPK
ncbi:hypothetical protein CDL15_Pgr024026 [Punica granatum]|uniref:Uncharacterized protein n=1 Tax=Punica granatum TaxID=22663 RepID=A0A218XR42_PUNGR|nr:hypothetical protein CDL15_Pgr024026 [Punica granatum]